MPKHHEASESNEEGKPVEVDQGALIHKILARYPGEFTLFRELLQNSDDAHSDTVEIHFKTATASQDPPTPPDLKPSDIVQWTFRNNGNKFTEEDWVRLSKIAMGNTNPAKVGAFGVGFYSLFSVTDHPIVLSGGVRMKFYWKNGQLYFRKSKTVSEGESSPGTTVEIPLRASCPMPEKIDLLRFLGTSITFMEHLKVVDVFLDGDCIGHIHKSPVRTEAINPPICLPHSGQSEMMTVRRLQCHRFTIQAKISTDIREPTLAEVPESSRQCSASQTPTQSDTCSATLSTGKFYTTKVDLTMFTAEVHAKVNEKLSKELLRSTSKSPPPEFNYSLVYTGKDEHDQSFPGQDPKIQPFISVFQGLRADLDGASHSRIFIGHSTSQTTGISGHMAAPFIPTVERESIDLVDRNVAVWNSELLYIGGFLARVVYELELTAIETLWRKASQPKCQDQLHDRFIHVLKFFTFYDSAPSSKVAQLLRHSFYSCSTSSLRLLSSVGVHHASDIRSFDPLRSKFLKYVPMLPPKVAEVAQRIVNALPKEHKIRTITLQDMSQDLCKHTLDEAALLAYLEWQIRYGSTAAMAELSKVVSFRSANGTSTQLSTIKSFIDPKGLGAHIPSDGPIPPFLIPRGIAKPFSLAQLASLGWREFMIVDWLQYISQPEIRSAKPEYDFVQSVDWAERVLYTISLAWSSSDKVRDLAKLVFANKKCIPVKRELYSPEETYLPRWDIHTFVDLNLRVVQFPSDREISWEMESLLVALGVRQHLAPRLLLKRMVETGKWNTSGLVDYLVQVAGDLNPTEIDELKSYDAFAGVVGGKSDNSKERFRADELYPPIEAFRKLHLRLIDWSGRSEWRDASPEAELMYRLGLRRHPPIEDTINMCSQDTDVGKCAFDYLCTNLRTVYSGYNPDKYRHIAFIPAENRSRLCLEKLGDVFLDNKWEALEFSVIQHKDREKILEELGVQRHPPSSLLLQLLKTKPPRNEEIARQWFEILFNHVSCFAQNELDILSQSPMIPKTISGQDRMWLTPVQCYLGKSRKHILYSKLFHFVNFDTWANQFLRACGAKDEPSEEDVAEYLVENHDKFYELAGHERFLQELRDLAARHTRIPNITISKMRLKPVLLGTQREETTNPDGRKTIHSLWEPKDIVIVNDVHAYQLFGDSIVAAPQNMTPELEDFYVLLGCKYLTKVVREQCNPSDETADQKMRSEYRILIKQRLLLFLRHYQPRAGIVTRFSGAIDVRVFERLSVSKTLVTENKNITKNRLVWALCHWATAENEQKMVQVWISRDAKRDMYELAVSLCRVLFGAVNLNDALLLTSILSEDLDVLRGRGYEVDRVLLDDGDTNPRRSIDLEAPSPLPTDATTQQTVTGADADSMPTHTEAHPSVGVSDAASGTPSSAVSLTLTKARNIVRDTLRFMSGIVASGSATPLPGAERPVTSQSDIRSTVEEAIQACNSRPLHYPGGCADTTDMIRFLDDRYCNVSEPIESLRLLGLMGDVEVHVGQGISNVDSFMQDMQDQIDHFVRILTRLAKIYDLPMDSLRIFYDTTAGCIAFNRKNTIYVNLRYFEAWHYQDVKNGNLRPALSSWFLTLAHEIAHNLVAGHDSYHGFLSSAICEARMIAFSQLLCRMGSE